MRRRAPETHLARALAVASFAGGVSPSNTRKSLLPVAFWSTFSQRDITTATLHADKVYVSTQDGPHALLLHAPIGTMGTALSELIQSEYCCCPVDTAQDTVSKVKVVSIVHELPHSHDRHVHAQHNTCQLRHC